jgi:hypothetical protein
MRVVIITTLVCLLLVSGTGICGNKIELSYEDMGVFEIFASFNGFMFCGYNANGMLIYNTTSGVYAVIDQKGRDTFVFDYMGIRYKAVGLLGNKIQLYKSPI